VLKVCLMTMCFAALAVSTALAQEKKAVPPPPKPADEGPSLQATMKFIQDKLNGIGPVNYITYVHDDVAGNDQNQQSKYEVTRVVADPTACRIGYHAKVEINGKVNHEGDAVFFLKNVGDISVVPGEQAMKEAVAAAGHPLWTVKVDPPNFTLKVNRTNSKVFNSFVFFDEQLANRMAKAMVHAVELCGGGSEPEPF